MLAYQLFRPVAYLCIKDESKWKVDWLAPVLLTVATVVIYTYLPVRPQLFLDKGFLDKLAVLLGILPGFYIAALAAIATFNKNDMDDYMPAPTPTVKIFFRGKSVPIKLSRRRMLSLQFGYLTFLSLLLFLVIVFANAVAESVKVLVSPASHRLTVEIFVGAYALCFWNMITVTLFGLYQLCDRMHQPEVGSVQGPMGGGSSTPSPPSP